MSNYISPEFSKLIASIVNNKNPKTEKDEILKNYIRLILILARKYVRQGVEYEDLISVGIVGLLEAHKNFDSKRSENFKTYAITRMKGRMYEYCVKNTTSISIPTHIGKTKVYTEKMTRLLNKDPYLFNNELKIADIIRVSEHPKESKLSDSVREELRNLKDKVDTLARHSRTTYEKLINLSYLSMVTELNEENINEFKPSEYSCGIEKEITIKEITDTLKENIGDKKTAVLLLHHQDYNNEDIADELFEKEITSRRITRQAVRGLLKSAEKKAKKHVREEK